MKTEDQSLSLDVEWRIKIRQILKKQVISMGTGLIWLEIGPRRTVMNTVKKIEITKMQELRDWLSDWCNS